MSKAELKLVESAAARPDYAPINDYGMIGDLHTGALVNSDGNRRTKRRRVIHR